ncbi:hypothetical protein QQX98_002723 [Neonectria punicea]|uniref:Uncharacterized protein n=1 Tax=Neonectria punicea TaxID=979145 RepID=A0ABR1HHM8_9HYPO
MSSGGTGSPEWDNDDLGINFDMIKLSDNQSSVDSLAQPLVTKLQTRGLTYPEKNVVSAIFDEDLVDWGSGSDEPDQDRPSAHIPKRRLNYAGTPSAEDNPRPIAWDDLTWGIKWIILKILDAHHRFAKTVSITLRLTRRQVHEFIAVYVKEYQHWQVYEDKVQKIPWNDLRLYAHESNKTVVDVVHEYRPRLSTDRISQQAIEIGCLFLRNNRLEKYVHELEGWSGVGAVDFLSLNVEGDILQDCLDRRTVKSAIETGVLDLEAFRKRLAPSPDPPVSRPGSPFLGTLKEKLSLGEPEEGTMTLGEDLFSEETIRQIWKKPTKARREPKKVRSTNRLTPKVSARELGKNVQPRHERELNSAVCRQYPDCFRYVDGQLVSTLIEEDRPVKPFRKATEFRQPQAVNEQKNSLRAVTASAQGKPVRVTCRSGQKDPPVKRGRAQAPRAEKPPVIDSQPVVKKANKNDTPKKAQNKGRPAALTAHLPPPAQEPISTLASSMSRISDNLDSHMRPMIENGFSAGYKTIRSSFNTPNNIFSQQNNRTRASFGAHREAAKPVPSEELRDLLSANFVPHAKKPAKKDKTRKARASSTESDDNEPEDVVVREAENDSDYQPNGSRKRKAPKKAAAGSARKNAHSEGHVDGGITGGKQESTPAKRRWSKKGNNESPSQLESPKGSKRSVPRKLLQALCPSRTESNDPHQQSVESGHPLSVTDTGHEMQIPSTPASVKNEPLFGIHRTTLLPGPLNRIDKAFYAWSADEATFAAISSRAHFAERADRIVLPPEGTPSNTAYPTESFKALQSLKREFAGVERGQKASVAQDAKEARFAGCADVAVYAGQAEEAFFALNLAGAGINKGEEPCVRVEEEKGGVADEDTPMPDASSEV